MTALLDELEEHATLERIDGHGCRVAWRRWGRGRPLVLLHGGHGSWRHWVHNIAALSADRMVCVPDMPGFGDSGDIGNDPHAADRLARLVDALSASVDRLCGASAAIGLAGFSFGGLVAATLAAQRGHVERLALLGSAGHGSRRRQAEALLDWRLPDRAAQLAALRQNLRILMLHDEARIDDLAMAVHERSCRQTRFRSKAVSLAGSLPQTLAAFDAPLLALWGRHDITATVDEAGPRVCDGHAERRWAVIEDAGHWVQYEQPAAVNAALREWFGA